MRIPMRFVDFGDGVSGAGVSINDYIEGSTKMVVSCDLIPFGGAAVFVIAMHDGRQLIVPFAKARCFEAVEGIDFLRGDHELNPEEREHLLKARTLVDETPAAKKVREAAETRLKA